MIGQTQAELTFHIPEAFLYAHAQPIQTHDLPVQRAGDRQGGGQMQGSLSRAAQTRLRRP